jgi:hypothetical protein
LSLSSLTVIASSPADSPTLCRRDADKRTLIY